MERRRNELVSRTSAAISLTFIIAVTPWAIKQVITSVTRTTAPALTDFLVTWLETSHGVWSPAIFWMLNPKFRSSLDRFFIRKILCRPLPLHWTNSGEDSGEWYPGRSLGASQSEQTRETIVREELWGQILDRSFSRTNLDQSEPVYFAELHDLQQQQQQQQQQPLPEQSQHHHRPFQNLAVTPTSICDRHKHQYSAG